MPSLRISDNLGVVVEFPLESPFKKVLRSDFVDALALPDLRHELEKPLAASNLKPSGGGLKIKEKVDLGARRPELSIDAGADVSLSITKENAELLAGGLAGDAVKVPPGSAYVGVTLSARVAPSLSRSGGAMTFGFAADSQMTLQNFRTFPGNTTVNSALKETVTGFVLPLTAADLGPESDNVIVSAAGSGSLKLTADVTIRAAPNPLAVPHLPPALPRLSLRAGASAGVSASVRIGGAYEIRVRKLDTHTVRLGYYKKEGTQLTVGVDARAGAAAGTAKRDFLPWILQAISSRPNAENDLIEGGLKQKQADEIGAAVKDGVQRNIEASLSAELSALRTGEVAFLYDIDLRVATAHAALRDALRGDISGLESASDGGEASGVTPRRSVWKTSRERSFALRVNLLGVLNYVSLSKLLLEGSVVVDPVAGELTITDTATATRLRALLANFGEQQDKVRRLFFEAMIATATYRGGELVESIDVKSSHSYFELHHKANRQNIKDNLDAIEAVGLLPEEAKRTAMANPGPFGRMTFYLEASYDDALCRAIFFDNESRARPERYYEDCGRKALSALVQAGDAEQERGVAANDDGLWESLRRAGSPGANLAILRQRFPGAAHPLLATIDGDFAFISAFWAPSMHRVAKRLAAMRELLSTRGMARNDPEFEEARDDLAKALARMAKDTKERFGDPLGLVALHYAAGRQGPISAKLVCSAFTLALPKAAVAV